MRARRGVIWLGAAGAMFAANVLVLRAIRGYLTSRPIVSEAPLGFRTLVANAGLAVGPPDAAVTVWIFGDYECPACQRLERLAGPRLRALAGRGDLRLVYVHTPIGTREPGRLAAAASYCADREGDPWDLHALLYSSAREWSSADDPRAAVLQLADTARIDRASLETCLHDPRAAELVQRDLRVGRLLGVDRVPTVIVNEQRVRMRRSPGELLQFVEERIRRRGERSE